MKIFRFLVFVLAVGFSCNLYAQQHTVSSVDIAGNKKVDKSALLLQIESKAGVVDRAKVTEDIKTLFGTGFFEQVQAKIVRDAGREVLVFDVVEKPVVRRIFVTGNDAVDSEDINTALDFKPGGFLDDLKVKTAMKRAASYYQGRGFYDAELDYSVVPVSSNQVDITFKVTEGEKYKIKDISVEGLDKLDEDDLLDPIQTATYKWWSSWILGTGRLNIDMLRNDRNIMRQELLNRGFLEATVSEPQITKKDKGLYITFV
ncbi:MAG: hypothetical protein H6619_01810, partial [Deltaproteobacteria bacterium]|nr:hypothetical protein [Deltaproteobacteria bacterium]